MKRSIDRVLAAGMWVLLAGVVAGRDYHVSPAGGDGNAGTAEQPFATLSKATAVLQPGDTCFLHGGVYREVLRPAISGRQGAAITFAAYRDEQPVISGAEALRDWKDEGNGVWSAPMGWTLEDGNQVFANGEMLCEACWPAAGDRHLFHPKRAVASAGSATTLQCPELPGPDDAWKGAQLWCAGGSAWICWTAEVTGYDAASLTLKFERKDDKWYNVREGSLFTLRGVRRALQAPGQWLYDKDAKRVLLIPPGGTDPNKLTIEAKRRNTIVDLSDRAHISLRGIELRAGGLSSNGKSSHLVLERVKARHVGHSYSRGNYTGSGVTIDGSHNLVLNCELGYSSGAVLALRGSDSRVINNLIHHGTYAGLWGGAVTLKGRRHVFSHNTVRHAGRDLIGTSGLMESLVQYNDVSDAGWLTKDLGMFYGHNNDFANTRFHHNLVHDNHAEHCSMGIYFDHLSHNAIVDHNVVWNVGMDPLRFNNPSYNNLVFNNSCWNTGLVSTFDHSKREDLFASRYTNNILNVPPRLPDHVAQVGNQVLKDPEFRDVEKRDFRISGGDAGDIGAHAGGAPLWRAGCDFYDPPDPLPVYAAPRVPWMNGLRNACFEFGTLEGWKLTGGTKAELAKGNGWGNGFGRGEIHATGTSKHELQLGPGRGEVCQVVEGLLPGVEYELSAWLRVSDGGGTMVVGVRDFGGKAVEASSADPAWTRKSVRFTTGPESRSACVFVRKSEGDGCGFADNLTLPLRPR